MSNIIQQCNFFSYVGHELLSTVCNPHSKQSMHVQPSGFKNCPSAHSISFVVANSPSSTPSHVNRISGSFGSAKHSSELGHRQTLVVSPLVGFEQVPSAIVKSQTN